MIPIPALIISVFLSFPSIDLKVDQSSTKVNHLSSPPEPSNPFGYLSHARLIQKMLCHGSHHCIQ
jgi:hypothetical protein